MSGLVDGVLLTIKGLLKDSPEAHPERVLYGEFAEQVGDPNSGVIGDTFQAARKGDFKAVRYGVDSDVELYNIVNDPSESNDISGAHKSMTKEFYDLFEKYKD